MTSAGPRAGGGAGSRARTLEGVAVLLRDGHARVGGPDVREDQRRHNFPRETIQVKVVPRGSHRGEHAGVDALRHVRRVESARRCVPLRLDSHSRSDIITESYDKRTSGRLWVHRSAGSSAGAALMGPCVRPAWLPAADARAGTFT